jgi:hypothetical protein
MLKKRKTAVKRFRGSVDRFIKKQILLNRLPTRVSISRAFGHGREIAQSKKRSKTAEKAKRFLFGFILNGRGKKNK